jgi:Cu+-exporting ATPase
MTFKLITYSLEKYSSHPIAKVIEMNWRTSHPLKWKTIEELKGIGMRAEDAEGNIYEAGSFKILPEGAEKSNHNIYVLKNKILIGWIDIMDEVRPEAKEVIRWLHSKNIKTIMLSGDRLENCLPVAKELGIEKVYAEQLPAEKLNKVAELNREMPTAMVGDGINDAPALAKATLGISLSEATQLALQSADVILMNHGLKKLPKALGLGKHTYMTIRQNLFWAFIYNIVAIPIAATGLLSPGIAALAMGFSDVVLAVNSTRLFVKKGFITSTK